ncbi:hypothetical protein BD410DRAFT_713943 [Rickenella mellea]|uniref:Peptidase S9 prolyl oligopeptidase catalytic domain-containing protein n=1 Tax=Rickenella mellea TaxID=50990 RepID=A0A4Y7QJZ5_9AGAM|nr:hypothetical protein BD410DRAFT_713943 [Rickenella mellea]
MADSAQVVLQESGWHVYFSSQWDVLGPFPLSAREQHFLSPAFPWNLSESIDTQLNRAWPSSYADNAHIRPTTAYSDAEGNLEVSFPDIRWETLRSTEGWSVLQHHAVLRTRLTITPPPPSENPPAVPRLLVDLVQGSYFTLVPRNDHDHTSKPFIPEWHAGNIYDMRRSLPSAVNLPTAPSFEQPTHYDLVVSGDYEIRLFGDPHSAGREYPVLKLRLAVKTESLNPEIVREPLMDVICDFVDGYAFGDALGIGLRSVNGWWSVDELSLLPDIPSVSGLELKLLNKARLAPSQARILPIAITQANRFTAKSLTFSIILKSTNSAHQQISISVTINFNHLSLWTQESFKDIKATYFYASAHASAFVVKPPMKHGEPAPPMLALHGAGVDVLSMTLWAEAIPRQQHRWVVIPTGRTAWGLDWHGPSAQDAFASVNALSGILRGQQVWKPWGFDPDIKIMLLGHSNGGQGAWYLASRDPDKVLGVVAAAGYIKSQLYVSLTHSRRSGHFLDPSLRGILESSLMPDDNDLFLSNLVDMPVFVIHGANDDNVPTWHSREYYSTLRSWRSDANITYREDPGVRHWYPEMFQKDDVKAFLGSLSHNDSLPSKSFTLTVGHPSQSGSLHGWTIDNQRIPGRLSRLHVVIEDGGLRVQTVNVHQFSFKPADIPKVSILSIDGKTFRFSPESGVSVHLLFYVASTAQGSQSEEPGRRQKRSIPPGRLLNILESSTPLSIVVPDVDRYPMALSVALRIAHNLAVYHQLDAEILTDSEAIEYVTHGTLSSGNLIIVGGYENTFTQYLLKFEETEFAVSDGIFTFGQSPIDRPSTGIIFTHPHPVNVNSMALIVSGTDESGLERALRLVPLRTGVPVPDWILIGDEADNRGGAGIIGAGLWDRDWRRSEAMSWTP